MATGRGQEKVNVKVCPGMLVARSLLYKGHEGYGVSVDVLSDLVRHCKFTSLPQDSVIIKQGDRGNRSVYYTECSEKKCKQQFSSVITLSNIDQSLLFFYYNTQDYSSKFAVKSLKIPPHPKCVATLPCEILNATC